MAKKKKQNKNLTNTKNIAVNKSSATKKQVTDNLDTDTLHEAGANQNLSSHVKLATFVLGTLLVVFYFLPWIDYGIDYFSGFGLHFKSSQIPKKILNEISFNTLFLIFSPIFGLWLIISGYFKNTGKWLELHAEQLSIVGFLGSLIFLIFTIKFSKYSTLGLYLTSITYILMTMDGLYIAWELDKIDRSLFITKEDITPSVILNTALIIFILLINYLLIPGKLIIGLTQFREFRRR